VITTEVVVDGLAFPECPRWRPDGLWLSDQHALDILRIAPGATTATAVATVDGGPSGLGWLPDGTLVAVSMLDHRLVAVVPSDGTGPAAVETLFDLSTLNPGPSNDMVVDARGRCYIGNIGFDYYGGAPMRPTVLVLADPAHRGEEDRQALRVVAEDLAIPNGMVITPSEDELIVAESGGRRLTSYRIAADGSLSDRQVFADLGDETPDGICLDAEGGVWFGSIGRREVVRVTRGGRVTDRVSTGERHAVACMLGGDDRRTLYVTTTGTLDHHVTVAMRSGAVEACRVAVPGAGRP
jgi:sugar lactone lactonase YvrE